METLQNAYRDDDDDVETISPSPNPNPNFNQSSTITPKSASETLIIPAHVSDPVSNPELNSEPTTVELGSEHSGNSGNENVETPEAKKSEGDDDFMEEDVPNLAEIAIMGSINGINGNVGGNKKSSKKKSKSNSVWTKPASRKGKKKAKNFNGSNNSGGSPRTEDTVLATPLPRLPDKNEDTNEAKICLSRVYKAEKVKLSEDRLSAGSCKGYRMVRATRGVSQGAWFYEIKVVHLGETGHTRLGWSMDKGDLQAPVGYDAFSFGYRDIDGCKVHKALRENYGEEGYKQGDVIGFYISLPDGDSFAPKAPHFVLYKGQKYACDSKEEPSKTVPGSEISFFKNGVCQGVAFKDLCGACYYPAASMYTLPNQPNCVVKFNFGPDFECYPTDFGDRPVPRPMIEVPYHGSDNQVENQNGALDENKQ